ncbi:MAG: YraN family protein [Clostridia bacterium]|nr:YraN family protein [Clostridia bacterium]
MKSDRNFSIRQRGKSGEKYVCDYLEKRGYKIVKTNYSSRYGEVDIIAENDKFIVFTEVKTRTENSFSAGFESITTGKIKKFIKTAVTYLVKFNIAKQPRIDCAQVIVNEDDNSLKRIDYLENAVDATGFSEVI